VCHISLYHLDHLALLYISVIYATCICRHLHKNKNIYRDKKNLMRHKNKKIQSDFSNARSSSGSFSMSLAGAQFSVPSPHRTRYCWPFPLFLFLVSRCTGCPPSLKGAVAPFLLVPFLVARVKTSLVRNRSAVKTSLVRNSSTLRTRKTQ